MAKMSYREALTETLHQEMANDENVIVMGEDVVGGTGSFNNAKKFDIRIQVPTYQKKLRLNQLILVL